MLTGDIARFLVESNWNKFVQSLIRFALLGIPAALVNSGTNGGNGGGGESCCVDAIDLM